MIFALTVGALKEVPTTIALGSPTVIVCPEADVSISLAVPAIVKV